MKATIAYIGGGSRGWAWVLMGDLAKEKELSGTVRLYDLDFAAAEANARIGNALRLRSDVAGDWTYLAVRTLEEALTGADVVVASILPGTFDEMESDVHAPEKYGVWQSVGDTAGPGGLMRALRTIPMYAEIAKAVERFCPDAWVVNYTNPMALCVRTLYETFPNIKAFGCCHEVFGTQKLLAQALADVRGIKDVAKDEIRVNVLGVNHFTWIDAASYRDIDLFPVYAEFVEVHFDEGWEGGRDAGHWMNSWFDSAERVKFDLFRRYGLIAAAGDRHLAEFCPPWYLADPRTVAEWKFTLTPVSWRKKNARDLAEKAVRLASGEEPFELKDSGEEGVGLIKALLGLGDTISNVNLPNGGQVEGLSLGAVVETNALFSRDSVRPVFAGRLPPDVETLVSHHAYAQATILQAALEKDRRLAFNAFIDDPLLRIGRADAEVLFDDMLRATAKYLPGWKA
jgi:alpha-galactosidase